MTYTPAQFNIVRLFQSTHPRRVWRIWWAPSSDSPGFNPHTHEGCDNSQRYCVCIPTVSIHTPTKGVTSYSLVIGRQKWVSIHTPTKGVTLLFLSYGMMILVSIHTPTKGVTYAELKSSRDYFVSIHTPTKGVTYAELKSARDYFVSIHTPTKGVTNFTWHNN